MKLQRYGKQNLYNRIRMSISERFAITETMKRYSSFTVYNPKIKKVWLGLAILCCATAIITTPIPVTGLILYPLGFTCFLRC